VHDVQRRAVELLQVVHVVQALARLRHDARRERRRHADARLHRFLRQARDALAGEVLHRDEDGVVGFTQVVDLHDVRVLEARRESRLVEKHLHELGLFRERRQHALDDLQLRKATQANLPRQKHLGHSTFAELGK